MLPKLFSAADFIFFRTHSLPNFVILTATIGSSISQHGTKNLICKMFAHKQIYCKFGQLTLQTFAWVVYSNLQCFKFASYLDINLHRCKFEMKFAIHLQCVQSCCKHITQICITLHRCFQYCKFDVFNNFANKLAKAKLYSKYVITFAISLP